MGRGEPLRVVACGLDSYSYAVSQITAEGYLRLHRIGNGSRHPLWDQTHEGQQLRVLTREWAGGGGDGSRQRALRGAAQGRDGGRNAE